MDLVYTDHALKQMRERRVSETEVRLTVGQPDDQRPSREGRTIAEKDFPAGAERRYTVRVVYIRRMETP